MQTSPLRLVAATFQVSAGLIAVLLTGLVITDLVGPESVDDTRGWLLGTAFVLGLGLFIIWLAARNRRGWLIVLTVISGALAVGMIIVATLEFRAARFDDRTGMWESFWSPVLAIVLWSTIAVACLVELRQLRRPDAERETPGWAMITAVAAPIALLAALVILLWQVSPGAMLRLNSEVVEPAAVDPAGASQLTGGQRWQRDVEDDADAVVTTGGLAVPVSADATHNAGLIMLDPTSGAVRWRYQLRGLDEAPDLAVTAGGGAVVVTPDDSSADEVPGDTFTLDAETGQVLGLWPGSDEITATDPPVRFRHVAQGANSVIALSPTGKKLWTYHPKSCADPRGAVSSPKVVLVPSRSCAEGDDGLRLLGLDAGTGKQRWVQPYDGGQQGPDQLLVRSDFELETTDHGLQRRDLNTGELDWSTKSLSTCAGNQDAGTASSQTVYLDRCLGEEDRPRTIAAYGIETGAHLWQRRLDRPIRSIAAVDDQQVLAAVSDDETCSVELVSQSETTTLLSLPVASDDWPRRAGVLCEYAAVLRVGDSYVLQVRFRPSEDSGTDKTRYIGLG